MSGLGYGILGAIAFVIGLWGIFKIAMWSAKREGIIEAQNDVLKSGAAKEHRASEILARPPADRDAILKWMRGEDKQP